MITTRTLSLSIMSSAAALLSTSAIAAPLATVERHGSYVAVEPFAPNVVHVTIALERDLTDKERRERLDALIGR
jgi:alpha-D-xyloside xylohydrolase